MVTPGDVKLKTPLKGRRYFILEQNEPKKSRIVIIYFEHCAE